MRERCKSRGDQDQQREERTAGTAPQIADQLDRVREGDREAYRELSNMIMKLLCRWQAFDLRDDWEDMAQDVLISILHAQDEGRVREPRALYAYLRSAVRFRMIDRVRARCRHREEPWSKGHEGIEEPASTSGLALAQALDRIPEGHRKAVIGLYVEGRTQHEATASTGIPLGSLKRYARKGLVELRAILSA